MKLFMALANDRSAPFKFLLWSERMNACVESCDIELTFVSVLLVALGMPPAW